MCVLFIIFRRDVLDELVKLQNFENQFLPNALRKFFQEAHPPNDRGSYLHDLVEKFSERFTTCNPQLGLSQGQSFYTILIMGYCINNSLYHQLQHMFYVTLCLHSFISHDWLSSKGNLLWPLTVSLPYRKHVWLTMQCYIVHQLYDPNFTKCLMYSTTK